MKYAILALALSTAVLSFASKAATPCEAIADGLISASMLTPNTSYDMRPVRGNLVEGCEIGADAKRDGANINDLIIAQTEQRNKDKNLSENNRAALKLFDTAFQLGYDITTK